MSYIANNIYPVIYGENANFGNITGLSIDLEDETGNIDVASLSIDNTPLITNQKSVVNVNLLECNKVDTNEFNLSNTSKIEFERPSPNNKAYIKWNEGTEWFDISDGDITNSQIAGTKYVEDNFVKNYDDSTITNANLTLTGDYSLGTGKITTDSVTANKIFNVGYGNNNVPFFDSNGMMQVDNDLNYNIVSDTLNVKNITTDNNISLRGKLIKYIGNRWIPESSYQEPFTRIKLTSTWVAYGDSFSQTGGAWGLTWPSYLATKTSTTVINRAIGATQTNTLTGSGDSKLPDNPVTNSAYANYTSIIMYGFNDTRHNGTLYTNNYWHQLMTMGAVLQLAVPQNKIIDAKTFGKVGTWTNTPTNVAAFGTYSSTSGNYVEQALGTCRYIAVQQFIVVNTVTDWSISVNGTFVRRIQSGATPTVLSGHGYFAIGYIIDMGSESTYTIRLTNNASTSNQFVNFVCPYTEAEANSSARDVLLLSIPRFNYEYTGASPYNTPSEAKRKALEDGFVDVARTCRKNKLPVSFCYLQNSGLGFYTDNIHPSTKQSEEWADEIIVNALE